ncbi:MAG: c-type cytochrome [Chloroflexi bacterium]|nr:c-type cytochrome [Chloroflexota bacterium]
MKRVLKWLGIVLGGLIVVIGIFILVVFLLANSKVNKSYTIEAAVTVPDDQISIERGRHLVETIGLCVECHGDDLAGDLLSDDPVFGTIAPRNLTSGQGGIGATFTDADYVRAIRHGVGKDGKALLIMPSNYYNRLSDVDLGAIIAYLKTIPAVDNELPESSLALAGKIFTLVDGSIIPASVIDHEAPRPADPVPGATEEYGEYLAVVCSACHGKTLSGGPLPGGDPDGGPAPIAPNIPPGGPIGDWTKEEFFATIRTGVTPYGKTLDTENMPWPGFAQLSDDELSAIWLYLTSLEAREFEK